MTIRFVGLLRVLWRSTVWLLREGIPGALVIIACVALLWAIHVRRNMIPAVRGTFGLYGQIVIPELDIPGTKIHEFSVSYTSGLFSLFGVPIPRTELLHVAIRYQVLGRTEQHLHRTFEFVCEENGECSTPYVLTGLLLCGTGTDGCLDSEDRWRYLREFKERAAIPPAPLPSPKPIPPLPPPSPSPSHPGPMFPSGAPRRI